MAGSKRIIPILLALFSLLSLALAASSTSFCKCTCFGNSTIIALTGSDSSTSSSKDTSPARRKTDADSQAHPGTCNDCNRKFCLDYKLSICKNAKDEDVVTTCFQRDSAKDQAVVFIFILATVGLLMYSIVRPWIESWAEKMRERRMYMPVSGESASIGGNREREAGADES